MYILGISTSSNNCSVAILENNKLIKESNIENEKTHSENLLPLIEKIFNETSISLSQINYLACDIGPGSFTGIRIGISTIKAISEVKNIPICPISSLEGLSYNISSYEGLIVCLIDARNDQAYCGIFNSDYSINTNFFADSISNIIDILKKKNMNLHFVGNATNIHYNILKSNFKDATFSNENTLRANGIAKAAILKISKNEICTADTLTPLYLRKSQAERMLDIKNGKN